VTAAWFRRAHETSDENERQRLWDDITCANMPVARAVARRYRGRGIADDDLAQVANLALVHAVHHFDITLNHDFLAFAVPTIRGQIKRHFRDNGWVVRPPRRLQELQIHIFRVRQELTQQLGHSPRPSEVAAHLGVERERVEEALACEGCFFPSSLDLRLGGDGTATLGETMAGTEGEFDAVEARVMLEPLLRGLGRRDRHVLAMRFVGQCSQQQIADDIGVTQMQVSRILTRILAALRQELLVDRRRAPDGTA
jgi:RNA polymerase sigma-B factor